MYNIAIIAPITAKFQQMYFCRQYVTMKTALWLYCFTCVKRRFHTGDNGSSPEWQGLFTWVMVQMVHSSCTDTAVNISRLCIQYDNRHLTSWLPQGKTKKNTLWGYRKFCHCMSLYISTIRWRNKNIAVRKQKITVRKVLSDYNLTTKMDMPGRQTFWEPGICNDIMCHAKEAVCILF